MPRNTPGQAGLKVFTLAMINVAAIASLRNLPVASEYGLGMIFFYSLAAVTFFIPTALVAAELATGWPQTGGIYVWVKEALGPRLGFLAVWMQMMNNLFWFPTVLSFIAGAIAYIFNPALASNKFFMITVMLVTFWGGTLLNFRGMQLSGLISSVGAVIGTLVPGALLIILAVVWVVGGQPVAMSLDTATLVPDLSNLKQVVFFVGLMLAFCGMEMSAVHAGEVANPQRDYPRAIALSAVLIFALSLLGSLAIAVVVPVKQMSLVTGIMQTFTAIFAALHLDWLTPIIAGLTALGAVAMVSTWIVGPAKGIMAVGRGGDLPPFFQKANAQGIPVNILLVQAAWVSFISLIFLVMPTISSSYWILIAICTQVYVVMYLLMFISAIVLRYRRPDTPRAYRVAGGRAGMWVVAGLGSAACLFALAIGFVPPDNLPAGDLVLHLRFMPNRWLHAVAISYATLYEAFMALGLLVMIGLPFLISHFKKPAWRSPEVEE